MYNFYRTVLPTVPNIAEHPGLRFSIHSLRNIESRLSLKLLEFKIHTQVDNVRIWEEEAKVAYRGPIIQHERRALLKVSK